MLYTRVQLIEFADVYVSEFCGDSMGAWSYYRVRSQQTRELRESSGTYRDNKIDNDEERHHNVSCKQSRLN